MYIGESGGIFSGGGRFLDFARDDIRHLAALLQVIHFVRY